MMSRGTEIVSVLMISPQFRPLIGGYERAAERLSTALAKAGMRIVVIAERRDRAWPAAESIDGYELRRLWCVYRCHLHSITSLLAFSHFLLRHGREFDVWHVHLCGYHAALALVLGKLMRRPVVLKLTSSAARGIKRALGGGITGSILRFLHRQVDACIATTDETREEAIQFGIPLARVHLIPNGVDSEQFVPAPLEERAAARRALGLDCNRLVLYVGRLAAEKNPLGLLDAWAAVDTKARQGALLALVGDGPDENQVYARVQTPSLARSVYLAGKRRDVAIWYRAADLYVVPSHREGLSNSMIEALASGLPVISTSVSGSSILLESPAAGVVVDVGNNESLARAMERLLRDASMRTRLGQNARLKFEARFLLETISKKISLLYDSLVNRSQSGIASDVRNPRHSC
jgi:glycosyltransferase involved in cell wall biosynthesis